jgi:hypothetical protein
MITKYEENKILFNYIIKTKYTLKIDTNENDILYIRYNNKDMKCRYILLFATTDDNIIWSDENPYIDNKTRYITQKTKEYINSNENIKNSKNSKDKTNKIIEIIIKEGYNIRDINYDNTRITPLWIVTQKNKKYIKYYMIIDIIYF